MTAFSPVLTLGAQLVDFQHHDKRADAAEKRRRAAAMLARCGVSAPARRLDGYAHELSGGMRQRAAIAAALLARPALLMADEPTTALDATTEAQILRLLDDLRGEAGGVIVVTHHLGVVAQLCDRAVVMYAGEVVEEGPVAALFGAPAHPYTAALLACDPARGAGRPLPTIPGEPPPLSPPPAGCAFRARCPAAADRCAEPQALRPVGAGRAARCWRAA
jgi:oligopeptide/dipeptide ABC transporter ATP-binding protein